MLTSSNSSLTDRNWPVADVLTMPARIVAANDNGGGKSTDPAVVEAALRHFAQFGLYAARAARHKAEQAFFAGHQEQYRWWLDICRQLDRRMADVAAHKLSK